MTESVPQNVPSGTSLAKASGVALVVAAVVLVTAVLPAEYGIDPLGTGKAMGLSAIAEPGAVVEGPPVPTDAGLVPTALAKAGAYYPAEYKFDSREITPDGGPEGYFESYDKSTRQGADGSLTAPFSGIHGWYWENPGGEPITIRITTAGFYMSALHIGSNKKRQAREVKALDALARDQD